MGSQICSSLPGSSFREERGDVPRPPRESEEASPLLGTAELALSRQLPQSNHHGSPYGLLLVFVNEHIRICVRG